jgi:hypothetical protein
MDTNQEDWHLRRLWQHAKNRGFNIRVDNDEIRVTPGLQWNTTPARSFTWNNEGIRAAYAWIDSITGNNKQPAQPELYPQTPAHPATASQHVVNAGAKAIGYIIGFVVVSLIIGGIADWWNNNHYNSTYQNNFITAYEGKGASAAACSCVYNQLTQHYSFSQAKAFDANPNDGDTQVAMQNLASQCQGL